MPAKKCTDPVILLERAKHRAYVVAQCQARYRGEEFMLTEQEYSEVWQEYWHLRGRRPHEFTLTRCDWDKPWTRDNVEVIERSEFWQRLLELQAQNRMDRR